MLTSRRSPPRRVAAKTRSVLELLEPRRLLAANGLSANYFDNIDFTAPKVTRIDPAVSFNWGVGSPDRTIGPDTFSVRWTGFVQARYSEVYRFFTTSDDGVRLWVNGQPLVNNFTDHAPTENSGVIALTAGAIYSIRMDFFEDKGGAAASLSWSSPSQPKQIIPASQLYNQIADSQPPTVPTNLAVTYTSDTVNVVSWSPSTDNLAVAGYNIFRDGLKIGVTSNTTFSDAGLLPATPYTYTLQAFDAANNVSAVTTPLVISTARSRSRRRGHGRAGRVFRQHGPHQPAHRPQRAGHQLQLGHWLPRSLHRPRHFLRPMDWRSSTPVF